VRRTAGNVALESTVTGRRVIVRDRTGDVEAVLDLIREGRSSDAAIAELVAKREGVCGASLKHAVAVLEQLGMLRDPNMKAAPGVRRNRSQRPDAAKTRAARQ
jgi:hypothetical protein